MSSWLGGIISKLSPRKSISLSNLSEDGTDSSTPIVENIEPDHRTTDYLEINEKRITRTAKIKRRRNTSQTQSVPPSPKPSGSPMQRRLSALLLREKSPARRFLTTGLNMLTRNATTSPPMSSPEGSDSEQDHTDGNQNEGNPAEPTDIQQNEETEDRYTSWVSGYVDSANMVKKQLFAKQASAEEASTSKAAHVLASNETEVAQGEVIDAATSTDDSNFAPMEPTPKHKKRKSSTPVPQKENEKETSCTTEANKERSGSRTSTRELRPRQESPKRKLFPFHFELKKRKRGPDFTVQEEREIVDHFKAHGGFGKRGGNTVWKQMELAGVCHPRPWQSLKQRFHAYILQDLDHFGVTEEDLLSVTVPEAQSQVDDTRAEKELQLELSNDEEEEEENFEDASEDVENQLSLTSDAGEETPSTPIRASADDQALPTTPINSSIKGSAVPGTPVYECQVLADRQAELLSEIRQLSQGITVGHLAPPGTPKKQAGKETLQEKARRTQSAPPASKSNELSSKEKPRQERVSVEKEVVPDVEKLKGQRIPYSEKEEQEMINYFLKYGGFLCKGGNIVWQRMEASKQVPGRTWQSLKERFNKYTCKKLHLFGVKKRDLIEGGSEKRAPVAQILAPSEPVNSPPRKRKRGPPYTIEEEMSMVKYFLNHLGKYAQRRGNLVWKEMEASRTCPGRSWASLKQRFSSFVQNNLEKFGVFEGAFMGVPELQLTKDSSQNNDNSADPKSSKEGTEEDVPNREEDTSGSKFRKPYSPKEEREIVDYLSAKGGFNRVGGNELWKEMEEEGVCKGRSWQSLKARYVKAISGRLEEFGTSREALENADMVLQKKKQHQKTSFLDSGDGVASDPEEEMTLQKETVTNNCEPEHSSEVDTQRLIDTIFGDEKELDIEVAELEDETNPSVAAEFHVEHNDEGEPSELDLLTIEMNSNRQQTNPIITNDSKGSQDEKDEFDCDSDSGSDTLMDRIIAKSKRGGSGGQKRGKRRKDVELETEEEETGLSIKEKLKVDKKRKAESQEVQDSPPKKRMRVS